MPSRNTLKKRGGSTSFGSANSKDLSPETRARRKKAKEYVNKLPIQKKKTSDTSKTKKSSNPHVSAWEWANDKLYTGNLKTALKGSSKSDKEAITRVIGNPDLIRIIEEYLKVEKRPYVPENYI